MVDDKPADGNRADDSLVDDVRADACLEDGNRAGGAQHLVAESLADAFPVGVPPADAIREDGRLRDEFRPRDVDQPSAD